MRFVCARRFHVEHFRHTLYRRRFGYGDDQNGLPAVVSCSARYRNSALSHQIHCMIHGIEEKTGILYRYFAFRRRRGTAESICGCRDDARLCRHLFRSAALRQVTRIFFGNYARKPFQTGNKCGTEDFFARNKHKLIFKFRYFGGGYRKSDSVP